MPTPLLYRLTTVILYLLLQFPARAQAPRYTLARAVGSSTATGPNNLSEASRTVVDAAGNMYVVGQFRGQVQFGRFTLTSRGAPHDIFVAKLDSTGTYQWVAQGGSLAEDSGNAIGLDAAGNIYIAGIVSSASAQFGSINVPNILPGVLSDDLVVAKLSPSGTWLWAVAGGGNREEKAAALALDAAGNVCVTGSSLSPSITFGTYAFTNPFFQYVSYTLKLTSNGSWLWAVIGGGNSGGSTESSDIALDDVGNAYITGYFMGPVVNFGSLQVNSGNLYPAVFVAKLSPSGQYQWVVKGGSGLYDFGQGIAVDSLRNVYVCGSFRSPTAAFGPFTLTNVNTSPTRTYADLFVAKLNTSGQYLWAVRGGGLYDDQGRSLRVDGQGNVLLTGFYNSPTISLGNTTLPNQNIGSPGDFGFYDTYAAKLNPAGQFLWGVRGGGNASDFSLDLAVGGPGKAPYLTGYFTTAPAVFGSFTLPANPGGSTGFVARLSAPPPAVHVLGDSLLCYGGQVTLQAIASATAQAYRWSTGATTAQISVSQAGTYSVTTTFPSGQTATTSFRVLAINPTLTIAGDTVFCAGFPGMIQARASPTPIAYQWSTGSQLGGINVSQPGVYTVTASFGSGCVLTAHVRVRIASVQIDGPLQICPDQGRTIQLNAQALGALSYRWSTGATTAQIAVSQAGTYTVTANFPYGCTATATQVVGALQASIQGDSVQCSGRSVQLSAANAAATAYAWSTGATTAQIAVSLPGTYTVTVSFGSGGCTATTRYVVRAEPANLPFSLGADTTLCEGDQFVVRGHPAAAAGVRYLWSDGTTGQTLLVQQPGMYRLQRITQCETQTASIQVTGRDCLLIPNIITPNHDGVNDLFVIQGLPPGAWALEVYNRWGRLVYQSAAYHADWGRDAAPGVYYYVLQEVGGRARRYKGWVEVRL